MRKTIFLIITTVSLAFTASAQKKSSISVVEVISNTNHLLAPALRRWITG